MNLDYVYRLDHFAKPGETIAAHKQRLNAGGKGLNQSIALARAGANVWHAGCVGKGGEMLTQMLKSNGVHTDYVFKVDELQGNAVIQVDRNGENSIILFGGSNRCITHKQIEQTLSGFGQGDWLVLQNEINNLPLIVNMAKGRGMEIMLNPSPFDKSVAMLDFDMLSWIVVNEIEAGQLTGFTEPEKIFRAVHGQYPDLSVLLTLGAGGSIAWNVANGRVYSCRQDIFHTNVVDTTGAGDTFTGYFIAGLAEGRDVQQSMMRAAKAASIAVGREGAAVSIPWSEELGFK